jgi:exodeoxyribonuclease-5/deoxyribonuclease V
VTHGFLHPEAVTNDSEERQMIVIIDADYNEEIGKAHIAGIVAETIFDEKEKMVVTAISDEIGEYIPGQFYKRELKSVELIIAQLEVSQIKLIVVDGYADFGTDKLALGAYVFEKYNIPVIGIGKNKFEGCKVPETEVYRGDSKKPLYVTCKGISLAEAKEMVEKMAGEYRLPYLVKYADSKARDWTL